MRNYLVPGYHNRIFKLKKKDCHIVHHAKPLGLGEFPK